MWGIRPRAAAARARAPRPATGHASSRRTAIPPDEPSPGRGDQAAADADGPLLEAVRLGRRVPDGGAPVSSWLFRGVELRLEAGELLTVQGATGSGKTLLLRTLAGLDDPDEGEVRLLGRSFAEWEPAEFRARCVYLHQSPDLEEGTVEAFLEAPFGFQAHHGARAYRREDAVALLEELDRPAAFLERHTGDLSGGERQVAALVRALLLEPTVLLLDEPTSALDPDATARAERLLRSWRRSGPDRALLLVTHQTGQAARVATRRLELRGGALRPADGAAPSPAVEGP